MQTIYKEEFGARREEVVDAIRAGKIFIYPTDTIYGLGCDAMNLESVTKIRLSKHRPDANPLSVIAPNKEWIVEHCVVPDERLLDKLPGPYTLIFERRNSDDLAAAVNMKDHTLGVRIIDHWFQEVVSLAGIPFVTTSANIAGEGFMKKFADIPEEIAQITDYLVYEGEKNGVPSTKINIVGLKTIWD